MFVVYHTDEYHHKNYYGWSRISWAYLQISAGASVSVCGSSLQTTPLLPKCLPSVVRGMWWKCPCNPQTKKHKMLATLYFYVFAVSFYLHHVMIVHIKWETMGMNNTFQGWKLYWTIWFLVGLSLHLKPSYSTMHENLLLAIWDTFHWIFFSNLDSRQHEKSLISSYGHFWNMADFGNSSAIWVFYQNWVPSEKFSQWRSNKSSIYLLSLKVGR